MSSQVIEAIHEEQDDYSPEEIERAAYIQAASTLDPEEVLFSACAVLPFHAESVLELIHVQQRDPWDDIATARIPPALAMRVCRDVLAAVAISIDGMATVKQVVGASA